MAAETIWATGGRKTAKARIFLKEGKGEISVNGKDLDTYFGRPVARMVIRRPLQLLELEGQVDLKTTVKGGGAFGQAQAISHGIAKALVKWNPDSKTILKKEGLLTRDSRKVERKKVGLHKARKAPQFSKR